MSSDKFFSSKAALITLIAACAVVVISVGIRQTFGLFYFDFETDLNVSMTDFGFAMGIQLLLWGFFGPVFGIITDKYGGAIAIFLGFIFYLLGLVMLYSGINTGFYFTLSMGVLIGVGLGSTAISIPVSIVAKHFPLSKRTVATSNVTAVGSFGYFISPMLTQYTLVEYGWQSTLLIFIFFIGFGLIITLFITTPKIKSDSNIENNQTAMEAIKEAFSNKSFNFLTLGFFVCGWQYT